MIYHTSGQGTTQAQYESIAHHAFDGSIIPTPTGRTASIIIAAYNAPASWKSQADFTCDGAGDSQIQAAFTYAFAHSIFDIQLSPGTFFPAAQIVMPSSNYSLWNIHGCGKLLTIIALPNLATVSPFTWDKSVQGLFFFKLSDLSFDCQGNANTAPFVDLGATSEMSAPQIIENVDFRNCPYGTVYLDIDHNEDIMLQNVYNLGTGVGRLQANTPDGQINIVGGVMGEIYSSAQTLMLTSTVVNGDIFWAPKDTPNKLAIDKCYANPFNVPFIVVDTLFGNTTVDASVVIRDSIIYRGGAGTVYFANNTAKNINVSSCNTVWDNATCTLFAYIPGGNLYIWSEGDDFTQVGTMPTNAQCQAIIPHPLPTSNPHVNGEWWNNAGVVTVSSG